MDFASFHDDLINYDLHTFRAIKLLRISCLLLNIRVLKEDLSLIINTIKWKEKLIFALTCTIFLIQIWLHKENLMCSFIQDGEPLGILHYL